MKFIGSLFGLRSPKTMGRQYMKVGRNALFGIKTDQNEDLCSEKVPKTLSLLISRNGKLKHAIAIMEWFTLFSILAKAWSCSVNQSLHIQCNQC